MCAANDCSSRSSSVEFALFHVPTSTVRIHCSGSLPVSILSGRSIPAFLLTFLGGFICTSLLSNEANEAKLLLIWLCLTCISFVWRAGSNLLPLIFRLNCPALDLKAWGLRTEVFCNGDCQQCISHPVVCASTFLPVCLAEQKVLVLIFISIYQWWDLSMFLFEAAHIYSKY